MVGGSSSLTESRGRVVVGAWGCRVPLGLLHAFVHSQLLLSSPHPINMATNPQDDAERVSTLYAILDADDIERSCVDSSEEAC